MKILAFTDVHDSKKAIRKIEKRVKRKKPDLIVCAGDISIFENGLEYLLFSLNQLNTPVLMIHGNHELENIMKRMCALFKNITFIHKKAHKYENCLFLGFGGGGFSLTDKRFEKTAKKFKKDIRKNKNMKIILITHAPPFGTRIDKIYKEHCGNKSISDFIKKNRIDIAISGHLHENFGKKDKIGNTLIINPGPYGKIIKINQNT
ncbi:MAG: metallophosphoesterase, partial [Nanoarchaeota archaeon]